MSSPFCLERVMGIEPTFSAWEADVLPLNYTRVRGACRRLRSRRARRRQSARTNDTVTQPILQGAKLKQHLPAKLSHGTAIVGGQ